MTDLTGLTAVITGGNNGIGRAMAIGIGKAGANIAIWARNEARNAETIEELSGLGAKAIAIPVDVADESNVTAAMEQTVGELGSLGCFVANAGISISAPIAEMTMDTWRQVMRTNLDGAFLCTREAARRFIAQGTGGSMIVLSSTVSRYGGAGLAAYATSKTGVLGLARTLTIELARHKVRCNILIPGWTYTGMTSELTRNDNFMAATTARTPVRRWAEPGEFHDVAAFLADPALTFHTGNEVIVDGGYTIF